MADWIMADTKTALVTGASRGIGQAIAVALAQAGYRVFCVSTRSGGCDETLVRCLASGVAGSALVCDVADAEAVRAMAKAVEQEVGRLDVLVNNAGITRDGLFMRMSDADFDAVIGVNLRGAFLTSKAGLIGFTKSLAKELGPRGVTVNLVAPGFIETDMTADLSTEIQDAAKQDIPLGRFGSPEDIAAAVQFLCSDGASYITGQVLMVDGGMAM
jgi:3-oxoacyl-[acyl-carrier protein] reductase